MTTNISKYCHTNNMEKTEIFTAITAISLVIALSATISIMQKAIGLID